MIDYSPVDDEQQQLKKPLAYQPVIPPKASLAVPSAPSGYVPPNVPSSPSLADMTSPASPLPLPRRPQPSDYVAPQLHGGKKALAAAFAGMGAFKSPELGREIYNEEFVAPQERENEKYKQAATAYDTELQQGVQQRAEQRAGEAEKAREELEGKQGQQFDLVPVTVPWQQDPVMVQRKDAERLQQEFAKGHTAETTTAQKVAGAQDVAEAKTKSAEDIAKERAASNERIARGRDLANTEIARIRAESGNDPNKLTNTMKTMKQQAQATLPGIDKAIDETQSVAELLGPGEGRWNNFWQGTVGISDPKFAHYKDEIGMISTAVTLAHARGRMSNQLFEHFQDMFNAGRQSPENMIQALNVAHEWLDGYAKLGEESSGGTKDFGPAPTGKKDGDTGILGDGTKIVIRKGRIVPQ